MFDESLRVVKPTGTVVVILGDQRINGSQFLLPYRFAIDACDRTGAILINDVTWRKLNPLPGSGRWLANCKEQVFVFAKTKSYYFHPTPFLMDKPSKTSKATKKLGQGYRGLIDRHLADDERPAAHKALDHLIEQVKNGEIVGFRMKIRGCHAMPWRGMESGASRAVSKNGFYIIRLRGRSIAKNVIAYATASRRGGTPSSGRPRGFGCHLHRWILQARRARLRSVLGIGHERDCRAGDGPHVHWYRDRSGIPQR